MVSVDRMKRTLSRNADRCACTYAVFAYGIFNHSFEVVPSKVLHLWLSSNTTVVRSSSVLSELVQLNFGLSS